MKKKMYQKRTGLCLAGLLLTASLFTGCGSSKASYSAAATDNSAASDAGGTYVTADTAAAIEEAYEFSMADEAKLEEAGMEPLEENVQATERKLIKTVDLYVETEAYDTLLANLEQQIAGLGGYIEYQYQYNGSSYSGYNETRSASMTARIPAKRLDEFVQRVGEQSNITNKEERVEDVTLQYVDLESRKKALATEQDRLLELLEKAESVEDIISIEARLSDVRYELESMESQLRTLNNQIDYSTINLSIQEVRRLTPTEEKSAWDKMKNGFAKSIYQIGDDIENGFIRFVINIPYLIIWGVIIVIAFLIVRRIYKKRKQKEIAKGQAWLAAHQEQQEMLGKEEEKK